MARHRCAHLCHCCLFPLFARILQGGRVSFQMSARAQKRLVRLRLQPGENESFQFPERFLPRFSSSFQINSIKMVMWHQRRILLGPADAAVDQSMCVDDCTTTNAAPETVVSHMNANSQPQDHAECPRCATLKDRTRNFVTVKSKLQPSELSVRFQRVELLEDLWKWSRESSRGFAPNAAGNASMKVSQR